MDIIGECEKLGDYVVNVVEADPAPCQTYDEYALQRD